MDIKEAKVKAEELVKHCNMIQRGGKQKFEGEHDYLAALNCAALASFILNLPEEEDLKNGK